MIIRMANKNDVDRILEIYRVYVEETPISFEYVAPDRETFLMRIENTLKRYPYLVCEENGVIVGYAYAGAHKEREAFKWCADTSIYIDGNHHGKGIGQALYNSLIELLKEQGIYKIYAVVTEPNKKSEIFHKKIGFESVAIFENIGYKLGKWWGIQYFHMIINNKEENPSEPKAIHEIIDVLNYKKYID